MNVDRAEPQTRFARSGRLNIAYQVIGEGPIDLVYVPGWVSHIELGWDEPLHATFLRGLASFARVIIFDKRGTGMSDRVSDDQLPTLEERMDDVRAVMDAVGSERAALLGVSEGGNMAMLFAATYPRRTLALATFGCFAKRLRSPDYPWAPTQQERAAAIEHVEREWGGAMDLSSIVPSCIHDREFMRRIATYLRRSATPSAAAALLRMNSQIDVRPVLPTIRVPTLVMHRRGDLDSKVEEGAWLAAQIPGARFLEMAGDDHLPWAGDQAAVLDEVQEFVTGARPLREVDRVLSTLLFIDVVSSTEELARVGDTAWRELLARYRAAVRAELAIHRGHEVDTAGDGFFATFDGPARAVRCGLRLNEAAGRLGLTLRAGAHTGEVELDGAHVTGLAVHIAARVSALARPGETLVSGTVKDLVCGSGLRFEDRGSHALKGVPGEWRLYASH